VVIGHLGSQIKDYFVREGIPARFVEQHERKGTGHALLQARPFAQDHFLVLGADNLWKSQDLREMAGKRLAIAGFSVDHPERYGVLEIKDGHLLSIIEKPERPPSRFINTALYSLTRDIFPLLEQLRPSPRGELELTDAVTALAKRHPVLVHTASFWIDLGRPEDIAGVEACAGSLAT
jgi:bifunctional UDP-N-acetylglucosamine pyrophosphorylase/glucosamine-1-phosphate N-acetyltransferase